MVLPSLPNCTVAIIGLGYVGLPLAVQFSKKNKLDNSSQLISRRIIGFDISEKRVNELKSNYDRTQEVTSKELICERKIEYTSKESTLNAADVYIITVPTPIDRSKNPVFEPLKNASRIVSLAIKSRSDMKKRLSKPIIIYESTVFPGATEEICVPILESFSGLGFNSDFFCGYSPERVNPGDKEHKLNSIVKVTSGSTKEVSQWVDDLYCSVIDAGTYNAKSIKIAEAAKVIENTQRDLNIALVNELAIIFKRIGIDTLDVLKAAGTKWNFLPFKPGLVGGHCIGVDPYYLTYKAQELGYYPQVVLAGRRINDYMSQWIADQIVLELSKKRFTIGGSRVLIMGMSFKEDCPDLRNSRVIDMVLNLNKYGIETVIIDPCVDPSAALAEYSQEVFPSLQKEERFAGVIAAVSHKQYINMGINEWEKLILPQGIFIDIKGIIPRELNPIRP